MKCKIRIGGEKKWKNFAGWKCEGKKVTKKTRINDICDGYDDSVTLKAVWYKKYEKKVAIRNKVFYNGKYFTLKNIKKGALKRVRKVSLRAPKKKQKKYRKMIRKAGKKLSK